MKIVTHKDSIILQAFTLPTTTKALFCTCTLPTHPLYTHIMRIFLQSHTEVCSRKHALFFSSDNCFFTAAIETWYACSFAALTSTLHQQSCLSPVSWRLIFAAATSGVRFWCKHTSLFPVTSLLVCASDWPVSILIQLPFRSICTSSASPLADWGMKISRGKENSDNKTFL